MTSITEAERSKYSAAWGIANYSDNSPGANFVPMFMAIAKPKEGQTVLDIGAGAGAGSRALAAQGLKVSAFDLVDDAWDNPDISLRTGCIWRDLKKPYEHFDYGFCADVMEHIPTQFVGASISAMLRCCDRVFYSISFKQDTHGNEIRDRLHLTVESFSWWLATFRELGTVIEARDLIGDGVYFIER